MERSSHSRWCHILLLHTVRQRYLRLLFTLHTLCVRYLALVPILENQSSEANFLRARCLQVVPILCSQLVLV
jgi:hypothetical protein